MGGDQAVPLALLTTEIVSNSFKLSTSENLNSTLLISLAVDTDRRATLSISDEAFISNPTSISPANAMGKTLIAAFAKQLGGEITLAGPPGTTTVIHFEI